MTGGIDCKIYLWAYKDNNFIRIKELGNHNDWVRDVAWCANIGLMCDTIASCSED